MDQSCLRCGTDLPEGANFCVACGADQREDDDFRFATPDPLIGQIVADRYHILELVGRGGMGVVYKVEHVLMGKLMAMKLLHGELSRDKEVVRRFKREATAVSQLSHPNTVQVFDFGRSDGLMYLIMEYIEGVELARLIRDRGPLPITRCAAVLSQVCASLAEAHDLGIIHRDLKPENVLLRRNREGLDQVKVLDFGLAKLREAEERSDTTCHGVLVGTPHYMSPEQIRGDDIDQRSDIYSLGALMYKVLCGDPPFPANTPVAVLTKHLSEPPPSVRDRFPDLDIPLAADGLIRQCLSKSPDQRPQTIDEVREELIFFLTEADAVDMLPSDSGLMPRLSSRPRRTEPGEAAGPNGQAKTPTGALRVGRRVLEIGSRGEFERFERSLVVKQIVSWVVVGLVVLVVLGVGAWQAAVVLGVDAAIDLHHRFFSTGQRAEREPNDVPSRAERLWVDTVVRGTVGKRVSLTESDRDWFLLRNEGAERRVLRAELDAIPEMDLVLEAVLFDSTGSTTIAEANAGGPGEGEVITGVLVSRPNVYLLVREEWILGRPPRENVSDFYQLRVELLDPEGHEAEPNDQPRSASKVRAGGVMRGAVGQPDDEDCYCVVGDGPGPEATRYTAVVLPPSEVALAIEPVSGEARAREVDGGALELDLGPDRCFRITARDAGVWDPRARYEVRAEPAVGDGAAPAPSSATPPPAVAAPGAHAGAP
jgi:serine/threonine-protein kinase